MEMERKQWPIDKRLFSLIGAPIRASISEFSPIITSGQSRPFISICNLVLPDNSKANERLVFYEGILESFERRIGVVILTLGSLAHVNAGEGVRFFRGKTAAFLHGAVTVKLAYPFQIELLPKDESNYWHDQRKAIAQLNFPFAR